MTITLGDVAIDVPPTVTSHGKSVALVVETRRDVRDWHARITEQGMVANLFETPYEGRDSKHVVCQYMLQGVSVQVISRVGAR